MPTYFSISAGPDHRFLDAISPPSDVKFPKGLATGIIATIPASGACSAAEKDADLRMNSGFGASRGILSSNVRDHP